MARLKPLERRLKGLPVYEAIGNLYVQPNADDIKKSNKNDPNECAYHFAIHRMLDGADSFIFGTAAYVQSLDDKGNPCWYRYIIDTKAKLWRKQFDQGRPVKPIGVVFKPATPSKTLEHMRQEMATRLQNPETRERYNATRKRHVRDIKTGRRKVGEKKKVKESVTSFFRSGTGLLCFRGSNPDGVTTRGQRKRVSTSTLAKRVAAKAKKTTTRTKKTARKRA